ncbi:hypothetical protein VDGL01_12164 [Verticillium dahliae]
MEEKKGFNYHQPHPHSNSPGPQQAEMADSSFDPGGSLTIITLEELVSSQTNSPFEPTFAAGRSPVLRLHDSSHVSVKFSKHPETGALLQPETPRMRQDDLIEEARRIHTRLVGFESECNEIYKCVKDTCSPTDEEWQDFTRSSITLLREYYDLMLVSQHPSAPEALKNLKDWPNMHTKMRDHGIHFLKLVDKHKPASCEHMRSFVYETHGLISCMQEICPEFKDDCSKYHDALSCFFLAVENDNAGSDDVSSIRYGSISIGSDDSTIDGDCETTSTSFQRAKLAGGNYETFTGNPASLPFKKSKQRLNDTPRVIRLYRNMILGHFENYTGDKRHEQLAEALMGQCRAYPHQRPPMQLPIHD